MKTHHARIYNGFHCDDGNSHNDKKHNGHDYECPRWTQLYSASAGYVTFSVDGYPDHCDCPGEGNMIRISHPIQGVHTEYYHLQAFTLFKAPVFVDIGVPIARVGATGHANWENGPSAPHAHMSVVAWGLGGDSPGSLVDPTPFYANDLSSEMGFTSGSCFGSDYPSPDFRFTTGRDIEPPTVSGVQIFASRVPSNGNRYLNVRCQFADPSGVYDDFTWPDLINPNARGACVFFRPTGASEDFVVPLHRIAGDMYSGTYETDWSFPVLGNQDQQPSIRMAIGCEDRAGEGWAFLGIGNRGLSEDIYISEAHFSSPPTELPLVDLAASILNAPTRIAAGYPFDLTVRVANVSSFRFDGGRGNVAINPTHNPNHLWHRNRFPAVFGGIRIGAV